MTACELAECILHQGKALVRAIEALGTIEPTGPFERASARLLMAAYKRRLRAIAETAPAWVTEEILSASESGDMKNRDEENNAIIQKILARKGKKVSLYLLNIPG